MLTSKRLILTFLTAVVLWPASVPIVAQEAPEAPADPVLQPLQKNWKEFIHFIKFGREDAARGYAQAILDSPAPDSEVYRLSETEDSQSRLRQGERLSKPLQQVIGKIRVRIARGFEEVRSDPKEIARQIQRLGGGMRAYQLAKERLKKSGEYALPQLLNEVISTKSENLRERIVGFLPELGKEAVRPLAAALVTDNPTLQKVVAASLGKMGYPHCAARLKEIIERKDILDDVRQTARRALRDCAGPAALAKPSAELFHQLAGDYYDRAESLRPDGRFEKANVWRWRNKRLEYTPVPRPIVCDVYAMRNAELTLEHDPEFYPAMSLWISAYLDREANLPAGQKDPVLGKDQQSARFYARAVGARFLQPALARALKDKNTPVAVGLIEALYDTTPADALVQPVAGGVRPLVSALGHPDRHVRLLAAVSLANALPTQRFNGHDQVMWVLNEALRQTGKRTVLLVADDEAQRNRLQDVLRTLDCQVIDQPDSGKALTHIRTAGNVDVVLLTDRPSPTVFVTALRNSPVLRQTPVACASNRVAVQDFAKADKQMVVLPAGAGPGALDQAINQALQQGAERPLTKEQAANWAVRAAKAIRLLGLTRNTILDITQSLTTLIETTRDPRAAVKVAAAEALAVVANADAQRAVAALANNAKVGEAVRISAYKALAESLRRFGNQLTESQSQDVVTVVKSKGSAALREAAAQALGAMNLPSEKVASVVTETVKSE